MKHPAVITVMAMALAAPPAAGLAFVAPLAEAPPGAHRHDGFYLRLGLGANYVRTSGEVVGDTWATGGGGLLLDLAVGGAVRENLVIFAHLLRLSAFDPTWQDAGVTFDWIDDPLHATGLGAGVAWYVMPANVQLGGSLLFLRLAKDDVKEQRSRIGAALDLSVGKEFFVRPQTGLGVNLHLLVGRSSWFDETFTTWGVGLNAAATFN